MTTRCLATPVFVVFCWLFLSTNVYAGETELHIARIRESTSGTSTAEVYTFSTTTSALKQPTSVSITIDGQSVGSVRVTCPPPLPPANVSSVLAIDISGSMARGGPNIELARVAARAWIEALSDESECAITAFDNQALLAHDMSRDQTSLLGAVEKLVPRGGTSYDAGLLHPQGGAYALAERGQHRKVVVFLTDGQGGGASETFIAEAQQRGITVFCVSLGMPMPDVLRRLADESGGLWFDNVTTIAQARLAYERIHAAATGNGPCTVSWTTTATCEPMRTFRFISEGDTVTVQQEVADSLITGVRYNPPSVDAGEVRGSNVVRQTVFVKAKGGSLTVSAIQLDGPSTMTVRPPTLPQTLLPGDSLSFDVEVRPGDTVYTLGRVDIVTSPCTVPPYYIASGSPTRPPLRPTIKVLHPNGGERFRIGSNVSLRYSGVPPTADVVLEVSSDNGTTWKRVAEQARNGEYMWKAEGPEGDMYRLRASQTMKDDEQRRTTPLVTMTGDKVRDAIFSHDGRYVLIGGWEQLQRGRTTKYGQVRIRDAASGAEIHHLVDAGYHMVLHPDGKTVITYGENTVSRFDIASGKRLWNVGWKEMNDAKRVALSADGSRILYVAGWGDTTKVLDASNGTVISRIPRAGDDINFADMSSDGKLVAVCDVDSTVRVYDATTAALVRELRLPGIRKFYRAAFRPTGQHLITTGSDGTAVLWDRQSWTKVRDITQRQYVNDNTYVTFSPDGRSVVLENGKDRTSIFDVDGGSERVTIQRAAEPGGAFNATYSPDGRFVTLMGFYKASIFDASTGVMIRQVRRAEGVPAFAPAGDRVVTIVNESTAEIFALSPPMLQADVSNAPWSLYKPSARLRDLRFSTRLVGQSVDSVIVGAVVNTGLDTVIVEKLTIQGLQAAEFDVRSTVPIIVPPRDSVPVEYSFQPTRQGELAAKVVAFTSAGILDARITGRALNGLITAKGGSYDVGTHPSGTIVETHNDELVKNATDYPLTIRSFRWVDGDSSVLRAQYRGTEILPPSTSAAFDIVFSPRRVGNYSSRFAFDIKELHDPVYVTIYGQADSSVRLTDPTTFRGIMLPTAVTVPAGTITTAVHAIVGLQASAGITDNVSVVAGGIIPVPTRLFGAEGFDASMTYGYGLGVKTGFDVAKNVKFGGGYIIASSTYDQDFSDKIDSRITAHAVFTTAGYGTDDHRVNVWLGYALKHHETAFEGSFDADATIVGLNADTRIADSWKICFEGVFMRTLTVVPLTITARTFGETWALDFGVTVTAIPASGATYGGVPLVPMVVWTKRW